jgi:DNA-binding MarR family transcriptional regulator
VKSEPNGVVGRPRHKSGEAVDTTPSTPTSIVLRLLAAHNLLLGELRKGFGDISLARFDLVVQLERENGQTLAALSRKMLVTAGNLTGLVDRAERDGIVERRPDATDRRLTRVWLTTKGERLTARAIRRHAELATQICAGLDRTEQDELRRLLGRFREAIEHYTPTAQESKGR